LHRRFVGTHHSPIYLPVCLPAWLRVHSFEVLSELLGRNVFFSAAEVAALYRRAGRE
jgi:hypothetical protein